MSPKGTFSFDVPPPEIYDPEDPDESLMGDFSSSESYFTVSGNIEGVDWESDRLRAPEEPQPPAIIIVSIPSAKLAGLDITRPITITQGE